MQGKPYLTHSEFYRDLSQIFLKAIFNTYYLNRWISL